MNGAVLRTKWYFVITPYSIHTHFSVISKLFFLIYHQPHRLVMSSIIVNYSKSDTVRTPAQSMSHVNNQSEVN